LTQPLIAIGLIIALAAVWLARQSVAFPLALAGIPTLITAILGSNPLPKGGATFLVGAWIALAIGLAVMRGTSDVTWRGVASAPVLLALLILAMMLLRLGSSPDETYGMTKVQLYVANNVLFLIGAVFVGADRRATRVFFVITLVVVAAGALLLLGKLVGGGAQQQYSGRFTLNAQQGAINLGRDSATGGLIAVALVLIAERMVVRLAALAVLPALLVALLAAGSRGPTIGFLLGLVTLVVLSATAGPARRRLVFVGVALIGAAFLIPLVVPGSAIGRALSAIVGSSSGLSSNGRSGIWAEALAAFGSHPLSGLGTGGFASIDPEMYPHNLFLETAAELGVVGLLAVASMIWLMFGRLVILWRGLHGNDRLEVTLVISLLAAGLFNAMVSGAIQDNTDVWLWGGLGLGLFARYQTPAAATQRRAVRALPIA
jgi:O-antigen ligase